MPDRERERVQRPAEPFEEQRAAGRVSAEQPRAAFAVDQAQDGDLTPGRRVAYGMSSFSTAGVPSASVASATNDSVAPS